MLRDVRIHYCTTHDSKTGITNKEKKISPIFVDFMIMISKRFGMYHLILNNWKRVTFDPMFNPKNVTILIIIYLKHEFSKLLTRTKKKS